MGKISAQYLHHIKCNFCITVYQMLISHGFVSSPKGPKRYSILNIGWVMDRKITRPSILPDVSCLDGNFRMDPISPT